MPNNHMDFGVDLLPSTDKAYVLGSPEKKWQIYSVPGVIDSRSYTGIIGTSNDNQGGGFFFLRVRGTTFNSLWRIKVRIHVTVPTNELYQMTVTSEIWGYSNYVNGYYNENKFLSTSYRPIYYVSVFLTNSTGYNNGCSHWIGFNLYNSTNPTDSSYLRNATVELLEYDNCAVELQDNLITPNNIPERAAHTSWYYNTNTSYNNFSTADHGYRFQGDQNSTLIANLYHANGAYITNSNLYRYQLLFNIDENTYTPLNNNNNVTGTTKTMLTDIEINPFAQIYYYYNTTAITSLGTIPASTMCYSRDGVDLRYTLNCGTTLTAHRFIYLVLNPTSNNKCKLASATPWTQTLPSSYDGKWYLLLGRAYNSYQISLYPNHPIYYHNGTELIQVYPNMTYSNADVGKTEFLISTNASSSAALTATSKKPSLSDGQFFAYMPLYEVPDSNQTLQLTLANGTTTNAYPIYIDESTQSSAKISAKQPIILVYYNSAFYVVNYNSYSIWQGSSY